MAKSRTYLRTHPWITFRVDLERIDYETWMRLGEAGSKVDHLAHVPMSPRLSDRLHEIYLAKGVWATTAIEGNTLSESEVLRRIEGARDLPPSQAYLGQEVDNVVRACRLISDETLVAQHTRVTVEEIERYNRMALESLELEKGVVPGEISRHEVSVGRYSGAPREDCEYLLQRLCEWLNDPGFHSEGACPIAFGLIRAALAHLYLAWIHPFGDGNGRTARLLEFKILLASGVPTPACHLLSNHYNVTRTEYYRQLQYTSESGGDVKRFLSYAVQGFVDGLREQLKLVWDQQWNIAWRDQVFGAFVKDESTSGKRQRDLVLAISDHGRPVTLAEIPDLSAILIRYYARASERTLRRDLAAMVEADLLKLEGKLYAPNLDLLRAFLPSRRLLEKAK